MNFGGKVMINDVVLLPFINLFITVMYSYDNFISIFISLLKYGSDLTVGGRDEVGDLGRQGRAG